MINTIHSWLGDNLKGYKSWHSFSYHSHVHWASVLIVTVMTGVSLVSAINTTYAAALPNLMVMGTDHIPDFSQDTSRTVVTATKSGNWSDVSVWSSGALPTASQIVIIPSGKSVTYDNTSGTAYTVFVEGELKYRNDINTKLTVTNLEVDMGGYLEIGTVSSPINSNVTAELVIADTPIDANLDPEQWGTSFLSLGKVRINGSVKDPTFIKVATEPLAGQTSITLSQAPTGWKVGDRIFIPDTRYYKQNEVNGDFYPNTPQWEEFTIQSISGSTITLNRALTYNHKGARDGNGNLDFLPHVGNLTRNVIIKSANPSGTRGHMAMMHAADVDIRYATFRDLGRTTYDPIVNGSNQKGRYALHMHHTYGPLSTPSNGYQFTLIGNAVDGGSSVHKFKWGITVHDSHYGLIKDNVVYNYPGAGIMTEDGNETMNVFDHNFVVRTDGVPYMRGGERGTEFGYEGAGIWLRGPSNVLKNNVVANFRRWGVAYFHEYLGNIRVPNYKGANTTTVGQYTTVSSYTLSIPEFSNHEIYGSGRMGFTYWWLGSDYRTPRSSTVSVIKDLKIWSVSDNGVWQYPSSKVTFDGLVIRGNAGPGSSCCGIGFNGGDYFGNDITIKNSDIQGMATGIVPTTDAKGTQLIENTILRNQTNIYIGTMWTSQCSATQILPRLTIIKNVQFSAPSGSALNNIVMSFNATAVRNIVQKDEVFVVDYNQVPGDNFRVYYNEAEPNYIVPQGYYSSQYGAQCVSLVSAPVGGLTNTQSQAQYGFAIGGSPATCSDNSTHPEINGITCPYTSISSAPLTSITIPSGFQPGPITNTNTQTATLTMSVSPTSITSGGSSTITWSSTVATSCTASGGWSGTKATSGTQSVTPTANTTYTLTCAGTNINPATKSVSVTVGAVQTQAPTVTISASPTTITAGGSSTITWSSTNATSCTASGGWSGTKATSGTLSVTPTANTTYTITCSGTGGTSPAQSTTINVNAVVSAPTVNISASPTSIVSGNSSTITWSSTNSTSCTASGSWSGTKATSGTQSVSPTANSTYTMTCTGAGGTSPAQSTTITVTPVVASAPTVTISASPTTITAGGSSTITWSSTNATSCTASGGWSGTKATSGTLSVTPTANTTYTITCSGTGGTSPAQSTTINVNAVVVVDTTAPTISNVSSSNITSSSVTISWTTNEASTGQVEFIGNCPSSGCVVDLTQGLVTNHSINISGLSAGTAYNFTVRSADIADNVGAKASNTFTTSTNTTTVPDPVVNLSTSQTSVNSGSSAVLSWSSSNAVSCTASDGWVGSKSTSGSESVTPKIDMRYALTCVNSAGVSVTSSVVIMVVSSGGTNTDSGNTSTDTTAPVISSVTKTKITSDSVTISWLTNEPSTGQIEFTQQCPSVGCIINLPSELTTSHFITITGFVPKTSYAFTVRSADATGNVGTVAGNTFTTLGVVVLTDSTPTVTISASPTSITSGKSATLSWKATNASSAYIDNGVGNVSLSGTKIVYPKQKTKYTITAIGTKTVTSSVTVNVSAPVLIPTAVGYWKLNSDSGTNAIDSSGNLFSGVLINGPVWSAGYMGNSVKFDGVNDYITFGNKTSFNITGDLAITAWINHRSNSYSDAIVAKGDCDKKACPFGLRINSTGAVCFVENNGSIEMDSICTTEKISLNTWTHVSATRTGSTIRIYLNGVLKKTGTVSKKPTANTSSLNIGGIGGVTGYTFDGRIDDVRLYNKALISTQIQKIMTQP